MKTLCTPHFLTHLNRYFPLLKQRPQHCLNLLQGDLAKSLHLFLRAVEQELIAGYLTPVPSYLGEKGSPTVKESIQNIIFYLLLQGDICSQLLLD